MQSPLPDALPVTRLDPREIPTEDQFEAWHQATAPLLDTALAADPATFTAGMTCYLVDTLVFNRTQFDRMRFSRGASHLANSETDCITVQYYKTGSIKGCLKDGTPLIMAPDRISIQDFAHAYSGSPSRRRPGLPGPNPLSFSPIRSQSVGYRAHRRLDDERDPEAASLAVQIADPLADVQRGVSMARLLNMLVDEGCLAGLQHLSVVRL